jgi:hypothetical protein
VSYDSRGLGAALPDQIAVAKKAVAVSGTATVDLALTTSTITGTITQNGAALPTESSRGQVVLSSALDVSTVSEPVATSGAATYSAKVYAGTYDLAFDSRSSTSLPDQTVSLAAARALSGAQTANFDVKVIDVTGKVTLNGGVLPDATQVRGDIELLPKGGGGTVSATLASKGAGTYTAHLYAGTYDVRVRSGSQQTVLPDQAATLKKAVALTASTSLDLDLVTTHVHGAITVDGAPMADETTTRGSVVFVERSTGSRIDAAAGKTGPATYDLTLFAGTYGVEFQTSSTSTVLPQQSTHVLDKKLAGDVALDVPLKTLTVTGVVKVNGADMPSDAANARGSVVFVDKLTGSRIDQSVGKTGAATYSLRLFDGGYDVHFDSRSSQTVLPDADDRALGGCVPVSTACSLSDKDLGGSWLLQFPGWGSMDLSLTQSGAALGGFADATWGSGPIADGTRTSSTVKLTATSGVDIFMTGDIANGCVMSGHAVAATGYTADWVGQRLE